MRSILFEFKKQKRNFLPAVPRKFNFGAFDFGAYWS